VGGGDLVESFSAASLVLPSSRAKYGWVEVAAFLDSPGWLSKLTNEISKYSKLNASIVMHRGTDCHCD